ncbi:MAG: phosphotransferase [Burkholderiales bacterium]|nr:phosphotransferase [Burkholderiales bacterium]
MTAPPQPPSGSPACPPASPGPSTSAAAAPAAPLAVAWADPARQAAFTQWLAREAPAHGLRPDTVRVASADASFRRYLRVDCAGGGSRIVMDAPPAQENCAPFVKVAGLMAQAGLQVPQVLAWDEAQGFMLLSDLGTQTLMDVIDRDHPGANLALYQQAVDALVAWQRASRPGVLPPYDAALLKRELALFPDWYVARHRGVVLSDRQRAVLDHAFERIVAHNLAAPSVFVHRDFMPRNLMRMAPRMAPTLPTACGSLAPGLGVLDFQDAVYGPITYDIASLMRDAFLSWDEDFVLDVTVRYWEQARKAGLLGARSASGWGEDFGEFYRGVEWMGLQRHLKVAGIFARLTLRDGKPRYLADAPRFIGYIRATAHRYRELGPLLKLIDEIEGTAAATGFAFGRV